MRAATGSRNLLTSVVLHCVAARQTQLYVSRSRARESARRDRDNCPCHALIESARNIDCEAAGTPEDRTVFVVVISGYFELAAKAEILNRVSAAENIVTIAAEDTAVLEKVTEHPSGLENYNADIDGSGRT